MTAGRPTVGLFGLLGSGNIGNDASMEAVLSYLRTDHPEAILDAMCSGPARLERRYRVQATELSWYARHHRRASGARAIALKALGKGIDTVRIAAWVRRHDVVIVPGMGVLETTLPVRALSMPLAIFQLCVWARVFGTKVALVSVGANAASQPLTRWFFRSAARLAFYRSYRDNISRAAMQPRRSGPSSQIYPDLAFGIQGLADDPGDPGGSGDPDVVGVGVMDFHGTGDDRRAADEIYRSYVKNVTRFILWLVDTGRTVRLYIGDTNGCDDRVIQEILADLRAIRPQLAPAQVTAEPVSSFADLTAAMSPVGAIVATRYHNLICALRLAKPAISIGYAAKHDVLMADMGLADFCLRADALSADRLIDKFTELQRRSGPLRHAITERNTVLARQVAEQFAALSAVLFSADPARHAGSATGQRSAARRAGQPETAEMTNADLH